MDPDPYQNVTDPQKCIQGKGIHRNGTELPGWRRGGDESRPEEWRGGGGRGG